MTDKADPNKPTDLARFLQDWTTLWREELQAQAGDPEGMSPAMLAGVLPRMPNPPAASGAMSPDMAAVIDTWRAAVVVWAQATGAQATGAQAVGVPPTAMAAPREPPATPRSPAAAAAPDPRDAEIERLARRVDALEARLAKLEPARRRRG